MVVARWLDEDEDRAWRGWLAMSSLLRTVIARDLQSECGLSDSEFAVLVHLSEAPGRRMRMTELATALGWSKSRLSHQSARMQGRGLVSRQGCPDDARSSYAVLTDRGRAEIEHAAPRHVESVRRHLIDLLDDVQLRALTGISERVISHFRETCEAGDGLPEVSDADALPPCPTQGRAANGAEPAD
jgi:DNA-binding MarR family transcriptional regulator